MMRSQRVPAVPDLLSPNATADDWAVACDAAERAGRPLLDGRAVRMLLGGAPAKAVYLAHRFADGRTARCIRPDAAAWRGAWLAAWRWLEGAGLIVVCARLPLAIQRAGWLRDLWLQHRVHRRRRTRHSVARKKNRAARAMRKKRQRQKSRKR